MIGLIGKKMKMTQLFTEEGKLIPVTPLKVSKGTVCELKAYSNNKNVAVLGFESVPTKHLNQARSGYFKSKKIDPVKVLKEFPVNNPENYKVGSSINIQLFQIGDLVNVTAKSKGKGFQGVMKRYNFGGGPRSHGCSVAHRAPGSIGQNTWPGKVFKGRKMAGHMGSEIVKLKKIEIVEMNTDEEIIYLKGSIPGSVNTYVTVQSINEKNENAFFSNNDQSNDKEAETAA